MGRAAVAALECRARGLGRGRGRARGTHLNPPATFTGVPVPPGILITEFGACTYWLTYTSPEVSSTATPVGSDSPLAIVVAVSPAPDGIFLMEPPVPPAGPLSATYTSPAEVT